MKVEIPSCGQRSEYERKVLALFGTQSMAKIVGCEEEGMSSMLIVSLTAEIASAESDRDVVLFRQQEQDIEHDGRLYELRGVKPVIHQEFLQRVNSLMQENMQTLSYSDISIEFLLNNDERADILVTGHDLWVDGQPYQHYYRQPMARRQRLELLISNVMTDLVMQGKLPVALYIYRQK